MRNLQTPNCPPPPRMSSACECRLQPMPARCYRCSVSLLELKLSTIQSRRKTQPRRRNIVGGPPFLVRGMKPPESDTCGSQPRKPMNNTIPNLPDRDFSSGSGRGPSNHPAIRNNVCRPSFPHGVVSAAWRVFATRLAKARLPENNTERSLVQSRRTYACIMSMTRGDSNTLDHSQWGISSRVYCFSTTAEHKITKETETERKTNTSVRNEKKPVIAAQ
jgi:hypothetical protein